LFIVELIKDVYRIITGKVLGVLDTLLLYQIIAASLEIITVTLEIITAT